MTTSFTSCDAVTATVHDNHYCTWQPLLYITAATVHDSRYCAWQPLRCMAATTGHDSHCARQPLCMTVHQCIRTAKASVQHYSKETSTSVHQCKVLQSSAHLWVHQYSNTAGPTSVYSNTAVQQYPPVCTAVQQYIGTHLCVKQYSSTYVPTCV